MLHWLSDCVGTVSHWLSDSVDTLVHLLSDSVGTLVLWLPDSVGTVITVVHLALYRLVDPLSVFSHSPMPTLPNIIKQETNFLLLLYLAGKN